MTPAESTKAEELIKDLNWRYATKKFDATRKIDAETFAAIEEALRLSASSYGLQPWKFIVVTDPEIKKQLSAAAYNQSQPGDCSHLIVLARIARVDQAHVDHYVDFVGQVRNLDSEKKAAYGGMLTNFVKNTPDAARDVWAANQCYIALGFLLSAAAALGVDACPMEGFDKAAFDRILDLPAKACHSVVLCPLGYRSADDHYADLAKVRFPVSEVVISV
ncbi:MAG: NAD(P)H-dependent oxidoreductase [Cyanobacteria bacterium REEB67]|nr:NAD(P)H-dependent oxidoreductase [Cyanobacteria bacterium REEB67]